MTNALVKKYWDSALRGAHWLLEQQHADGSFAALEEGIDGYYKIPYALTVCGYPRQAHQLIDWTIQSGALTPNGDLRGAAVKATNTGHEDCYSYSNSWMIIGAARLGRFDYARPAMAFLRTFISPANGGVFARLESARAGAGMQDMVSTSQAGSACLYMGQYAEAMQIGDWFVNMLRWQPDLQHKLYACSEPTAGLITAYPAAEAVTYVVDTTQDMQWYFYPGIAMGFLSKLYLATRKREYLEASEAYFDFFTRCVDEKFRNGTSGKVAWGSAQMSWITGEEKYRQVAVTVGDWMIDVQRDDGHWDPGAPNPNTHYLRLDATAEFVAWQAEIAQHLDR